MTDQRKRRIISDTHELAAMLAGVRRTVTRSLSDDSTATPEDVRSHTMAVFIALCDRYAIKRGGEIPQFKQTPTENSHDHATD